MAPGRPGTGTREVLGGRYELGELLGAGGVAEVYRARDLVLERDVAVKLFGPGVDARGPERERAEITTLAGLSHPNLVAVHDAGTAEGCSPPRAYLVMGLVEGPSLEQVLATGPLPHDRVREIGAQVAEALACVHESGVVHRDVKPSNILVDPRGRPFLADFGIAQALGGAALTAVGETVGTASYLSPEQVRGERVGPAADVYALGLVLLEALTGRREYPGTSAEAALARLTRPPHVPEDLPATWQVLLREMTASEASQRPAAEQVAQRLGAASAPAGATRVLPTADAPTPTRSLRVPRVTAARPHAVSPAGVSGRITRYPGPALVLVAVATLLLLLVLVATGGRSGGGSPVPSTPSGPPGPARLGPDLARLHELVQP